MLDKKIDEKNNDILEKFAGIQSLSALKEFVVGSTAGMSSVAMGRQAVSYTALFLLCLRLLEHKGVIDINWDGIKRNYEEINYTFGDSMRQFIQHNTFIALGFVIGTLTEYIMNKPFPQL